MSGHVERQVGLELVDRRPVMTSTCAVEAVEGSVCAGDVRRMMSIVVQAECFGAVVGLERVDRVAQLGKRVVPTIAVERGQRAWQVTHGRLGSDCRHGPEPVEVRGRSRADEVGHWGLLVVGAGGELGLGEP